MGCGTSSVKSSVVLPANKENTKLIEEIHTAVTQGDVQQICDIILPLSRDRHVTLEREYGEVRGVSLVEALAALSDEVFWRLTLHEDLVTDRVTALGNSATDDEMFDVYTCVFQTHDKDKIKELSSKFIEQNPNFLNPLRLYNDQSEEYPDNGISARISKFKESPLDHYATRMHSYVENKSKEALLFILLCRSEVDLYDISTIYKNKYKQDIYTDINNLLTSPIPKLHLLDHSQVQEEEGVTKADNKNTAISNVSEVTNTQQEKDPVVSAKVTEKLEEVSRLLAELSDNNIAELEDAIMEVVKLDRNSMNSRSEEVCKKVEDCKIGTEEYRRIIFCLACNLQTSSSVLLSNAITDNSSSTVDIMLMILLSSIDIIPEINSSFVALSKDQNTLHEVLGNNLSGDFQIFISALLTKVRDKGEIVDINAAKEDAVRLHEVKDFKWQGEENVFIDVFVLRHVAQLREIFNQYYQVSGSDISEFILSEFTLHLQKALLVIVYITNNSVENYLAKFLHESRKKSHFMVILTWIVASRYTTDLTKIQQQYKSKYDESLLALLENISSVDPNTRRVLEKIINQASS